MHTIIFEMGFAWWLRDKLSTCNAGGTTDNKQDLMHSMGITASYYISI